MLEAFCCSGVIILLFYYTLLNFESAKSETSSDSIRLQRFVFCANSNSAIFCKHLYCNLGDASLSGLWSCLLSLNQVITLVTLDSLPLSPLLGANLQIYRPLTIIISIDFVIKIFFMEHFKLPWGEILKFWGPW